MIKRAQHAITMAEFDSIRRAVNAGNSIRVTAEAHGVSRDTVGRIVKAKNWGAYLKWKEAYREKERKAAARRKAAQELVEATPITDPDAPEPEQIGIMDEIHEMRPSPFDSVEVGGLPDMICERIHALSRVPAAMEIIMKAVTICPESIGTIVDALYFPLFGRKNI